MTYGFPVFSAYPIGVHIVVVPPVTTTESTLNISISGSLHQFTGAVDAEHQVVILTGSLKQFVASVSMLEEDDMSISASLYQFTGAASITVGANNTIQIDSEDVSIDSEPVEIAA